MYKVVHAEHFLILRIFDVFLPVILQDEFHFFRFVARGFVEHHGYPLIAIENQMLGCYFFGIGEVEGAWAISFVGRVFEFCPNPERSVRDELSSVR